MLQPAGAWSGVFGRPFWVGRTRVTARSRYQDLALFSSRNRLPGHPGQKKPTSLPQNGMKVGKKLATTYSRIALRYTTIGAATFHFRVRDGNGWFHRAIITRGPMGSPRSTTAGRILIQTLATFFQRAFDDRHRSPPTRRFSPVGPRSLTTAYRIKQIKMITPRIACA